MGSLAEEVYMDLTVRSKLRTWKLCPALVHGR
jgi:hypothetical protein